jgi:hypothetical protein
MIIKVETKVNMIIMVNCEEFILNKPKYLKISVTLLYLRYKYAIMFD